MDNVQSSSFAPERKKLVLEYNKGEFYFKKGEEKGRAYYPNATQR